MGAVVATKTAVSTDNGRFHGSTHCAKWRMLGVRSGLATFYPWRWGAFVGIVVPSSRTALSNGTRLILGQFFPSRQNSARTKDDNWSRSDCQLLLVSLVLSWMRLVFPLDTNTMYVGVKR